MNKSRREFLSNCLVGGFFTLFGLLIGKNFQSKAEPIPISSVDNSLRTKEQLQDDFVPAKTYTNVFGKEDLEAIIVVPKKRILVGAVDQLTVSTSIEVIGNYTTMISPKPQSFTKGKKITVGSMVLTKYSDISFPSKPFDLEIRKKDSNEVMFTIYEMQITQETTGWGDAAIHRDIGLAFCASGINYGKNEI